MVAGAQMVRVHDVRETVDRGPPRRWRAGGVVKGKWAAGIPPRHLTWVLPERLAASERPGGQSSSHRKVRRSEEIIWRARTASGW